MYRETNEKRRRDTGERARSDGTKRKARRNPEGFLCGV